MPSKTMLQDVLATIKLNLSVKFCGVIIAHVIRTEKHGLYIVELAGGQIKCFSNLLWF